MRAVLGLLFLLGGLSMGYLVLSGKALTPSTLASTSTYTNTPLPTPLSNTQQSQSMQAKNTGSGPMGMAAASAYYSDLTASKGMS